MADTRETLQSSIAGANALSRWARRIGAAAVAGVVGVALYGPAPVQAQLPELLPSSSSTAPPSTASPDSTLLPPLEQLAPPSTAPGTETTALLPLPTAAPGSPGPTLLPAPKTTRTTTFNTLPVPPRTRSRVTTTTLQRSIAASTPPVVEDVEGGDREGGFEGTLPFTAEDEQIQAAGLHTELGGGEGGSQDPVTLMASIAAGLIALVLLGVVGWLQAQVRGRPHLW
ncbi:MAG TPA: hypothetical protein VM242_14730 [Acidimicrobiales bacterium]|nr:hypothetical protein [Acidimicrobiales bacterium]